MRGGSATGLPILCRRITRNLSANSQSTGRPYICFDVGTRGTCGRDGDRAWQRACGAIGRFGYASQTADRKAKLSFAFINTPYEAFDQKVQMRLVVDEDFNALGQWLLEIRSKSNRESGAGRDDRPMLFQGGSPRHSFSSTKRPR